MPNQRSKSAGRRSWKLYTMFPPIILLVALGVSISLWLREIALEKGGAEREFFHRANRIHAMVAVRINRTEDLLRAVVASFSDQQGQSAQRWSDFVRVADIRRNHPAIIGIGYVTYVRHAELPLFLANRETESAGFGVFPSGDRDDYMINTYIEPMPELARINGFDVGSEPQRRLTLERARDQAALAVTPKLTLLSAGNILMYLPVYRYGMAVVTVDERRAAIQGWAVASVTVADLMANILETGEPISLAIYDGEPGQSSVLLDSDGTRSGVIGQIPEDQRSLRRLEVGGRTWTVLVASTRPYPSQLKTANTVLVTGVLLALISWWGAQLALGRQKRLEFAALASSQEAWETGERLRLVLENSNDAFWDWNLTDDTVFYASRIGIMLGYREPDAFSNSESLRQLLHPDDRADVRRRFVSMFKSDRTRIEHEFRLRASSGEWRWFRENAAIAERKDGRVTRMVGTITDIHSRRQAEDFLRLLSTVVEQSPMAVVITDAKARIEYVNARFVQLTDYTSDEALGQTPAIIKSGLTPPATYRALWAALEGGREWRGELQNRKKNGELYWEDTVITPVRSRDGEIHYVAVKEDITLRRRIQVEMEDLAKLPEESPDPILRIGQQGEVLYANVAARNLLSRHPDLHLEWRVTLMSCLYGRSPKDQDLNFDDRIFSFRFVPIRGASYVNVYAHDITQRRQVEERLRQGLKMEAIGTLAGGIAHDFNNILTSILGYNNLIIGDSADPATLADDVRQIHIAATRAKDLVRQILSFSRTAKTAKGPIDLRKSVDEVIPLVRTATPPQISVSVDLAISDAWIIGTPVQIHQLLINLCTNARDALENGAGQIDIGLSRLSPGWVRLEVSDTGVGIPQAIRAQIFDPFFTTKPVGQGTGLGLSVVHGIVLDLEGRISVLDRPEGGTRFIIDLPEAGEAEQSRIDDIEMPVGSAGSGTILVVDDEPAISAMLQRFLIRQGHHVLTASSAVEALACMEAVGPVDVVITDQMMPGMSGVELAGLIHDRTPDTAVILCSGRDDQVSPEQCQAASIFSFLAKPLNMIELIEAVSRAMARENQALSGGE